MKISETKESLLATTAVYASLRFGNEVVSRIIGERSVITETPLFQEILGEVKAEAKAESIVEALKFRFNNVPQSLAPQVESITDLDRLSELFEVAVTCENITAFQDALE